MEEERRVVGEYELQEEVGKGSFAVVWRATHRGTGAQVAVKEIDRAKVDARVSDGILQEIGILSSLSHPNILRLLDTIHTEKKLYLILEYCDGGDLAGYVRKHGTRGRLLEAGARGFMRQLAEGLKVLRGRAIIHRDLKPQNLLLSSNGETTTLKIGDFGFARSLMRENLADTLCGSPLYMAPEIVLEKEYDAKADLWSVGVILFQLVTGKLPFNGKSHYQLCQNILASDDLQFPPEVKADLHPDCIDLCRRLLCRDPKKRITFEEFFSHKFFAITRIKEVVAESSNAVDLRDTGQATSSDVLKVKSESTDAKNSKVFDSWEWIEREYVLVHANCTSTEMLSSLEKSTNDNSATRAASYDQTTGKGPVQMQTRDSVCRVVSTTSHVSSPLSISRESTTVEDLRGTSLHPFTRVHLLHQYIVVLTELAREKLLTGLDLEALSLELVILAIWKEALHVCSIFMAAAREGGSTTFDYENVQPKSDHSSPNIAQGLDFTRPLSICSWAENGFIKAYDHAEEISNRLRENNDNTEMPDAMEIVFQTALLYGKSGAVNEVVGQQNRAVTLYSKAIILFTFILHEATTLPLNPLFSLSPFNQRRIHRYITNLRSHLCSAQVAGQQPRLAQ